jgi:glyoxylase-like metal-dependent hydrolase (beta-lactamase superfamily II)
MVLRQFLHDQPAIAASYLLGCAGKGVAVIVDPVNDPQFYERAVANLGMRIRYVIDTHLHADHRSTGRSLAASTGADYVLHESARPEYPFRRVADGDELVAGNMSLRVMHLPGHTPEHIGLLVTDRTRSDQPWFIMTGHTLMVGDMGRTELASSAEIGARSLYESARRLRALPDDVLVLPGAFAGSVCGRGLSGTPVSTIGFERRANRAFRLENEREFVALMLEDVPPRPPDADETRKANMAAVLATVPS